MTYVKQNWFKDTFFPKRAEPFIDPVIHQIGYDKVAEALVTPSTLETSVTEIDGPIIAGASIGPARGPTITVTDTNSPEYHLGLTERMITTLQRRIGQATIARTDQRQAFELDREERAAKQEASDTAQAAEIAGLVKSLAAYTAARDVLAVPPPVPMARDVQDVKPRRRKPARVDNGTSGALDMG